MKFAFDEEKSQENRAKHGIDFVEAQRLWLDPSAIMGPADSRTEERHIFIGMIGVTIWAAIITFRGSSTRIISVRKARSEERQVYESQ